MRFHRNPHTAPLAILSFLLIGACAQEEEATGSGMATSADVSALNGPSIYESAVANGARPEAERARDAGRKPAEVLEFLKIRPGMTVLDMFTGAGYYAEIIAGVVGDDGRVIAHSNKAYLEYVGPAFAERFESGRLANVDVLMAENNELELEAGSLDAVMMVLSFHDLFYVDSENGWPKIEVAPFLAELHNGLKPGGTVGIIDHNAAPGTPSESGGTVHRIDPAIVVAAMKDAGFELVGRSDLLNNPDDDLNVNVFDDAVRGKTDRFILCFRKPA